MVEMITGGENFFFLTFSPYAEVRDPSFPSVLFDHVGKLDYKLALLVLLTRLERVLLDLKRF